MVRVFAVAFAAEFEKQEQRGEGIGGEQQVRDRCLQPRRRASARDLSCFSARLGAPLQGWVLDRGGAFRILNL